MGESKRVRGGGGALAEVQKRHGDGRERDWEENTGRHSQRLLCAKHCSSCVCVCVCVPADM